MGSDKSNFQMTIPFNKPHLFPECIDHVRKAVEDGKMSGDGAFSKECTEWLQQKFQYHSCLLTPSCTAALEIAALVLDIQPGDEVICPSFTFVSTANAFALRGATIVFADSERDSPSVSIEDIKRQITPKTKAIVVVHYAGVVMDLADLASTGIPIVEDCAHAFGSIDPRTKLAAGHQGSLATFSFHDTKNVAIGEGGLLFVRDSNLWEPAQIVRNIGTNYHQFQQGKTPFYTWTGLGSMYRLSDLNAGILWGCFQNFDTLQSRRHTTWETYDKMVFPSSVFRKPKHRANAHMYYLSFRNATMADDFREFMKGKQVVVAKHYPPLDRSPYAAVQHQRRSPVRGLIGKSSYEPSFLPQSTYWSTCLVRLPLFHELQLSSQLEITRAVNEFSKSRGWIVVPPTTESHIEGIRMIRNENRKSFGDSSIVDVKTHSRFMRNQKGKYRVCISNNDVIGFIGTVGDDLRLAVRRDYMGRGVGSFMVDTFFQNLRPLAKKVKRDNVQSLRFCAKYGWVPDPSVDETVDPVPLVKIVAGEGLYRPPKSRL